MSRLLTVTFTEAEAAELLVVAGNGFGDGDFYGLNGTDEPCRGGKRAADTYLRASAKLAEALRHRKPSPVRAKADG